MHSKKNSMIIYMHSKNAFKKNKKRKIKKIFLSIVSEKKEYKNFWI